MERTDYFMHTRASRLEGLREYAQRKTSLPGMLDLSTRLATIDAAACTGEQEVAFIHEYHDALVAAGQPEGLAWAKWQPIRAEWSRVATERAPDKPWANFYASDHSTVFLRNLNECMRVMRGDPPMPLRIHIIMSALTQVHGLLDNYLWKQVFTLARDLAKEDVAPAVAVQAFLDLRWVRDLPLPLSDVRDGWNHGTAELDREGLVVLDRQTRQPKARLSVKDLERYVIMGRAAWDAINLDMAFGAALGERKEGKPIHLEDLPERLRPRRPKG